ncbi:putative uncharacterized protein DDB_G0290521 [Littorina saxatilis]|uniref:putative uncharacterized protein DDB_G0290521 n=1 Tax=Littorina saxatilis TaxID=31220 RepID=UPI0038B5974C
MDMLNEDPNAELVAELPEEDGKVPKVYKVTPKDDSPIKVDDPRDVLEQSKPDNKDDFPINKYGPVRVVVVDNTPEPKPVVFCEKLTTGTTVTPVEQTTGPVEQTTGTPSGPPTGTPSGPPTGTPTGPPTPPTGTPTGLTTGPSVPTTQPTETGCPQEMSPQVPGGPGPIEGEKPGTFVEVNDFPTGTFVEDVPDEDENDKPDGEVFSSVEPDPETKQFKPTPNEPLLIIVRPGETPEQPTDGSRTPQDVVNEDPNAELVAELPEEDGKVPKVYKVTPKDDSPIKVDDPRDVLEQSKPDDKDDFPINKYGPVRVVVVDNTPEPKPVVFCEKLTTGKPRVL